MATPPAEARLLVCLNVLYGAGRDDALALHPLWSTVPNTHSLVLTAAALPKLSGPDFILFARHTTNPPGALVQSTSSKPGPANLDMHTTLR